MRIIFKKIITIYIKIPPPPSRGWITNKVYYILWAVVPLYFIAASERYKSLLPDAERTFPFPVGKL